jgi:16S rRNA (adenine1518-N6/adenine1519-N6)-dimethyltransferase
MPIAPKKYFGQHFLKEQSIAERIADSLQGFGSSFEQVLEIGPGPGMLTGFLAERFGNRLHLVEIDHDMISNLRLKFPEIKDQILRQDFLEMDIKAMFPDGVGIIGNFPYNISSQIIFKAVEHRDIIPELVGMFQREVGQRITAKPGNKIYGLLSAWVQAFYEVEYLFTVSEGSFNPPPKVKSGVIRLTRRADYVHDTDEKLLLSIIKSAFNQRRKTLRNALSGYKEFFEGIDPEILDKRAEALGYEEYLALTKIIANGRK